MDSTAPEGRLLATIGRLLFSHQLSTVQILIALGFLAGSVVLLRHFLFDRIAFGRNLVRVSHWLEVGVLSLIVISMVFLAAAQVAFRNLAHAGILWIDPLLRYLTLWITFLGAAVATREGRHIQMDVLGQVLPPALKRLSHRITHFAAAITCMVLVEAAYRYLIAEYQGGEREFLQIPTWILLAIIPLAFGIMAYRFLFRACFPRPDEPEVKMPVELAP